MKKNKSKSQKPSQDRKDGKKVIADPRFEKLHSDPRFQKPSIHKAKVAIDSRFNLMFTDKRFSGSSAPLDKRGKPKKQASVNPLRWYYRVEEEEEEKKNEERGGEGEEEQEKLKKNEVIGGRKRGGSETESSDSDSGDELDVLKSEDEDDEEELDSDATTSTTDTDEEKEDLDVDDGSSDVEEDVPVIESETHRLAAVNMDWDRIKAVDLFVVLSSFVPKGGQIVSVAVYPSEFGLKRMEEEAVSGPVGLFDNDDKDDRDASDDEIDDEKVRNYEKSRLRYYFAVVECDSSATADYLYKACDGHGFGGEDAYPLDLRFIPNSVEFKHQPRDVAEELPAGYEGLYTKTRGLQHTNLLLSWDEDDPHRARTLKRKFNAEQLAELELKEFLASDESEEDEDDNSETTEGNLKNKYRALLQNNDDADEDEGQDMEVTFNTGLEDLSKKILEKKDKKSETAWEAYIRKRKEKKKARKNKSKFSSDDESDDDADQESQEQQPDDDFFEEEPPLKKKVRDDKNEKQVSNTEKEAEASKAELELLLADDDGADNKLKGYKIKPKKAKGKNGKETFNDEKIPNLDYEDPRFSSLFKSPLFALDPTDPQFKRSATYARQLAQQQQKGRVELLEEESMRLPEQTKLVSKQTDQNKDEGIKADRSLSKEKHELSLLVKSIKLKSKQIYVPSAVKKSQGKIRCKKY